MLLSSKKHEKFAIKGLGVLAHYFDGLDASRTWLCYWSTHTLRLLNREVPHQQQISAFLRKCYNNDTGGFGGGPQQMAHLAPCYSAVNALVELQDFEFLKKIKEDSSLVSFFNSMKNPDGNQKGSFLMHKNGEFDTRSAYCAISCTNLLGLKEVDFSDTFEWLLSCQTYEGGFGGIPGAEAHGGYTFCALAGLILLDKSRLVNSHISEMMRCLSWLNRRQMTIEGGFNGRTNKLVDACYSFWQGASPVLLKKYVFGGHESENDDEVELFNDVALAAYMLGCCQASFGGLIDKPGKGPDFYHTCYGMSGYSLTKMGKMDGLQEIDPLYNVLKRFVDEAREKLD